MDEYERQGNDSDTEKPSTRTGLSQCKRPPQLRVDRLQSNCRVLGEKHGMKGKDYIHS